MKLVTIGVEDTIIMLRQTGERTVKNMARHLEQSAELIADTAKEMAPIEHGDLREAIRANPQRGDNGRTEVVVDIDPNAADERGVSVMYYGAILNTALEPYGSGGYKLGKLSRAISAGQIGGRFMQRAVLEHKAAIYLKAQQIANNVGKGRR